MGRVRSQSLTEWDAPLPSITENGIRLGTPVAREAAKSFWSMDMLKTSLNRMAFYADCENHSQGSLESPTDSGFHSRVPSARSTPTIPQLPHITASSTPSSPHYAMRNERRASSPAQDDPNSFLSPPFLRSVTDSPLLVARREKETASPTPNSAAHSSTSLTSTSKTISPSLSSQALLPRRRQLGRSRSADHPKQPLLPQRKISGAWSDSSVYRVRHGNTVLQELRLNTLNC